MTNQLQTQKRAQAALRAEYQLTQALRHQAERSECLLGFHVEALADRVIAGILSNAPA